MECGRGRGTNHPSESAAAVVVVVHCLADRLLSSLGLSVSQQHWRSPVHYGQQYKMLQLVELATATTTIIPFQLSERSWRDRLCLCLCDLVANDGQARDAGRRHQEKASKLVAAAAARRVAPGGS